MHASPSQEREAALAESGTDRIPREERGPLEHEDSALFLEAPGQGMADEILGNRGPDLQAHRKGGPSAGAEGLGPGTAACALL